MAQDENGIAMAVTMLISGASGFVGQALSARAEHQGYVVREALRTEGCGSASESVEPVVVGEISRDTNWEHALRNVDVVIHLAARVHVMKDASADPLADFRKVNVQGTENLARQAIRAGVKRLVYVSSIGVHGLLTAPGQSYSETDIPRPHNAYTLSKWEAEQCLLRVAEETGLEVVIVRPPLVYGAGAPGNFKQLIKVIAKRVPLPLATTHNLRSFVYVGNLVDALLVCATHPAAAGQTYLVSDGEDISTSDLLRQLGEEMGRPARIFPCPPALLRWAGRMTGKSDQVDRLLGSLQIDSGKIFRDLQWRPPYSMRDGLRLTVKS